MARRAFTLIELVVVMAIILAATVLVVASFRGETPSMKLDNGALSFESWTAQVRYRASEMGRDFVEHYDFGGRSLSAVPDYSEKELEKIELENVSEVEKHVWNVPEGCTLVTASGSESAMANTDELEVLRFFPDGGAQAVEILVLKCEEFARSFDLSFLNGRLIVTENDASLDYNPDGEVTESKI